MDTLKWKLMEISNDKVYNPILWIIHIKQANKQTQPKQPKQRHQNMGFTTNTKFVLLKLRQRNFWSIHIQISTNLKKFVFNQFYTFHPPPICVHFIDAEKHMRGLMSNFVHFIHPYMNPLLLLELHSQASPFPGSLYFSFKLF